MGASNPLASNNTVAGRTKNRRVEITFTSPVPKSTAVN
jgi:outer membrane protein OmpA-like peptidoglycan-associated protein